jgi:DNA-binding transcriptional LysR family regulator
MISLENLDILSNLLDNRFMSDLNQMMAFVRVIKEGSFSKAAAGMGVPKSTISHRVQELEKRLGVGLLRRTTRQLHLTPAGESYYKRALVLLQDLELLEEQTKSEQNLAQGRLKFTAPSEMGNTMLAPFLCEFVREYPLIELEIELSDRRVDLIQEGFDCALRSGRLADSTLRSRHIGQSEFGLYASPEYLKKAPPLEGIEELMYHKCLLFSPDLTDEVVWRLQSNAKKRDLKPIA